MPLLLLSCVSNGQTEYGRVIEEFDALDNEGNSLKLEITFDYSLEGANHKTLGRKFGDYKRRILIPEARSAARQVAWQFSSGEIYNYKRPLIEETIFNKVKEVFAEYEIQVQKFRVSSVKLQEDVKERLSDEARSMAQASGVDNVLTVRNRILASGQIVVNALNEGNVEALLGEYWQSDSAMFIINGRQIKGYDQIGKRLAESIKYRKKMELVVTSEDVLIHSMISATHIVEFKQTITALDDTISKSEGIWTAVYRKINGAWKAVYVHESYYPVSED